MTPDQKKIMDEGVAKLRAAGVTVPDGVLFPDLTKIIEQHIGRKITRKTSDSSFVYAFVHPARAPAPESRPRPAWRPDPHPRAAEIDAAQPPVMTPCGTGNWTEHSQLWRR